MGKAKLKPSPPRKPLRERNLPGSCGARAKPMREIPVIAGPDWPIATPTMSENTRIEKLA
eukprot:1697300-Prymnesium_polylepis.1